MDGDRDDFRKSLDYTQDIIKRQSSNSFKIKGWSVTLIVVVLLFRSNKYQFLSAFIPLFGFWYLDAYYLRLERKYRKLYSEKISEQPNEIANLYKLETRSLGPMVWPTAILMFSKSLRWFYGIIAILLIVYGLLIFITGVPF